MNKLKVLVSLITDDNDYQLEQAASAQAAAVKLGANVQIIYSGNDAVQQTQQILSFIQDPSKRPDAILAEPVGTGMAQIAKAAVGAGIAWGIINSDVDYIGTATPTRPGSGLFGPVGPRSHRARFRASRWPLSWANRDAFFILEGPAGTWPKLRTKGMLPTKPAGVDIKTLQGDWTQKSGYHAVKSWLSLSTSRQLHVGMIACQNDDMAIGARRAFEELARLRDRDAWLPPSLHRMRRRSQLRPGVGSPGPAVGDRDFSTPCGRRLAVAGDGFRGGVSAAGSHARRAQRRSPL